MVTRKTLRPYALVLSGALVVFLSKQTSEGFPLEANYPKHLRASSEQSAPVESEHRSSKVEFVHSAPENSLKNHIAYEGEGVPPSPPPSSTLPRREWPSRFELGGNYTRMHLKPSGSQSFNGNLWGAKGIYEYRPLDQIYAGGFLTYKEGELHGSSAKRSLLYIDAQERLGYTFSFSHHEWLLTLYTGVGFRYINQKLTPSGSSSLRFRYNEFYVPVGFETDREVNSWFTYGLSFTWMPQVFPTVSISPLQGAHWSLKKTITNFYVELPLDFTLTKNKRFHLILKPFYEHWKDGRSTAKTSTGIPLGLPSNTYDFWGADLNFAFCF